MLFRKYRLLIFTDNGTPHMTMRVWSGFFFIIFLLFALSIAGLVFLQPYPQLYSEAEQRSLNLENTLLNQRDMIFELDRRALEAEADFSKVRDLNPKLRIMLNLASEDNRNTTATVSRPSLLKGHLVPALFLKSMMREKQQWLADLYTSIRLEETQQQNLIHEVSVQKERLTRIPIIWPTRGRIVSDFGYRIAPFTGKRSFHKGIDIHAGRGTPIHATANGVVTRAEWFSTYGKAVDINHGDGITTRYAHMSKIIAKNGEHVTRGQVIGLVGNTGRSQAPHVHYEVQLNGKVVNPINYILR